MPQKVAPERPSILDLHLFLAMLHFYPCMLYLSWLNWRHGDVSVSTSFHPAGYFFKFNVKAGTWRIGQTAGLERIQSKFGQQEKVTFFGQRKPQLIIAVIFAAIMISACYLRVPGGSNKRKDDGIFSSMQSRKRSSWLRICTGRSQSSSEDSSEVNGLRPFMRMLLI